MMPVGAPTTLFSASWPIRASSCRSSPSSQRSFRATATAHSTAAEEDSPAPAGTSEVSARSMPAAAWGIAQATPRGYAAQPVRESGSRSSRLTSTTPEKALLATRSRRSARARAATVVRLSIAIGNAKPPL